jgi:hypothetical protein
MTMTAAGVAYVVGMMIFKNKERYYLEKEEG